LTELTEYLHLFATLYNTILLTISNFSAALEQRHSIIYATLRQEYIDRYSGISWKRRSRKCWTRLSK